MRTPERIYRRVEAILATKGGPSESAYPGQKFRHDFKPGAQDWALPDRTLVVTPGGTFAPADGSALLTSRLIRVKNLGRLHQRIGRERWHVNPPRRADPEVSPGFRLSELVRLAKRRTKDPARQRSLVEAYLAGTSRTLPRRAARRNPLLTIVGAANPPHARRSTMVGQLLNVENVKKVGAAGIGAVAAAGAPSAVFGAGVTTTQAYATQAGVALVGAWAVGRWVGRAYAVPWFLGAGVGALQDPIRRAIAKAYGAVSAALPGSTAMSRYMGADSYYESSGPNYLGVRPGASAGLGRRPSYMFAR